MSKEKTMYRISDLDKWGDILNKTNFSNSNLIDRRKCSHSTGFKIYFTFALLW
jgi:hypothetical protein